MALPLQCPTSQLSTLHTPLPPPHSSSSSSSSPSSPLLLLLLPHHTPTPLYAPHPHSHLPSAPSWRGTVQRSFLRACGREASTSSPGPGLPISHTSGTPCLTSRLTGIVRRADAQLCSVLSPPHTVTLSHYHIVTLSHCHTHNVTLLNTLTECAHVRDHTGLNHYVIMM